MEPRPSTLDSPVSSFKSAASSSSHASSLTACSFDFSGYPPQSEMEEVPSFRWLRSSDLRAAASFETTLRSSGRERDPPPSSFRRRRQREDTRPSKGRQTASPSPSKNIFLRLFRMNVLQYAHHDMSDAADPNAAVTYSQFPLATNHQMHDLEGGDGEYLPGIEAFQIIGQANPGCTLRTCGFPINGTTLCLFQWVCHLQDGSSQYIKGATNPEYVVTADDAGKLLAVECIPMDDSGRQGELVKHFAKDQKLACGESRASAILGEDLPGVEAFQIIGDAKPGRTLRACGFPMNGTTLCMFQWVHHLQDGTWQYIKGATNPDYLVTADDVDKLISVECVAMDDSGRQGELLKLFANDHKVIKFGKLRACVISLVCSGGIAPDKCGGKCCEKASC